MMDSLLLNGIQRRHTLNTRCSQQTEEEGFFVDCMPCLQTSEGDQLNVELYLLYLKQKIWPRVMPAIGSYTSENATIKIQLQQNAVEAIQIKVVTAQNGMSFISWQKVPERHSDEFCGPNGPRTWMLPQTRSVF